MNKSTIPGVISKIGLAVTLLALMPRSSTAPEEFRAKATLAFAVAVTLSLALRFGLPWILAAHKSGAQIMSTDPIGPQPPKAFFWRSLKVSCLAALAATMMSGVLGMNHLLSGQSILYVCVVVQQLAFLAGCYYIATYPPQGSETYLRTLSLISLAAIAVFCSWSSNIVLEVQQPPIPPRSSDLKNMLYSIPVLSVALWGILRALRRQRY